jgi:hypothetical protein
MPRVSGQIELLIGGSTTHIPSQDDQKIIDTLAGLVPSAALSYQQAIADLKDGSRVSFRGPALELRETLREVVDYMAPDAAVEKSPGVPTGRKALWSDDEAEGSVHPSNTTAKHVFERVTPRCKRN